MLKCSISWATACEKRSPARKHWKDSKVGKIIVLGAGWLVFFSVIHLPSLIFSFLLLPLYALGSITFACILRPILHFHGILFAFFLSVIMSLLLFNAGKWTTSLLLSRVRSKFTLNVSACRLHFYKWHKCQFSASCGVTQEVLFIVCARAPLVRCAIGRDRIVARWCVYSS